MAAVVSIGRGRRMMCMTAVGNAADDRRIMSITVFSKHKKAVERIRIQHIGNGKRPFYVIKIKFKYYPGLFYDVSYVLWVFLFLTRYVGK